MLAVLQRVRANTIDRKERLRLRFRSPWTNLAQRMGKCRARVGPYCEWHREVRRCFKESGRARRLHRMLPLSSLAFAMLVTCVWMINSLAGQVFQLMVVLPDFLAQHFGVIVFYPNGFSLVAGVMFAVGVAAAVRFEALPGIRSSSGWQKAAKAVVAAAIAVWGVLMGFVMATGGVALGFECVFGSVLWPLILGYWALEIAGFSEVFFGWFWLTKVVSLRWPWMGWLITALAWFFSVHIARFVAENTKWLHPPNLHSAFDVIGVFGVMAMEWYAKTATTFAAAVPWVVEFRLLRGLKREGASFRDGEYYQRWCKPADDKFPTIRQMLRESWASARHSGPTPTHEDGSLRTIYRQLFREIFS